MILVFGTICIDRVRSVARLPGPGGYVEVEGERLMLGGEAANTANALAHWGAEIRLAGNPLGSGSEGALLRDLLIEHGLEVEYNSTIEEGSLTPVCDIYVTPDGERTMFGLGFSDMASKVEPERIGFVPGNLFTAEPNMGAVARCAARLASEAGMRTYLMDFIREDDPIAPGSFWQSSTDWAGTRNNMQKNVTWVKEWVTRHGCFAILSDGPNGFVAGGPDHPVQAYPPYPAPLVVDTTGAGDVFRAGMLYGLEQGWPTLKCLAFASAAGCLKCRALGATSDVPTVAEIEAHIATHREVSKAFE